jgi:hypothetical protein
MDDCNKVLAEETECVDFKMFFSCSVDEYNNKLCDIIEDTPFVVPLAVYFPPPNETDRRWVTFVDKKLNYPNILSNYTPI